MSRVVTTDREAIAGVVRAFFAVFASGPAEFRVDRDNVCQHIAFGRGVHSCPGGPLARVEGRITLERIYEPSWFRRGLSELHLESLSDEQRAAMLALMEVVASDEPAARGREPDSERRHGDDR